MRSGCEEDKFEFVKNPNFISRFSKRRVISGTKSRRKRSKDTNTRGAKAIYFTGHIRNGKTEKDIKKNI